MWLTISVEGEKCATVYTPGGEKLRKLSMGYERFVPGEIDSFVPLGMWGRRTDDIKPQHSKELF